MQKTTEKNKVEFDLIKTIKTIQDDKVLDEIFTNGKDISYNMLYTLAKSNSINPETTTTLENIFNQLILNNKKLLEKYIAYEDKPVKLSKHYGKKRILKDIEKNGVMTELDRAMLSLNNLRNITSKLRARGIKDKVNGTNILSESDCRTIVATVRIVENNIKKILNKKL
jgi:hypothetical protein